MLDHLTADYERAAEPDKPVSGERRLVCAVIILALEDALPHLKRKRTVRVPKSDTALKKERALAWLLKEQDPDCSTVMSLDWCCRALGFPAERIRNRVRATLGRRAPKGTEKYVTLRYSELAG